MPLSHPDGGKPFLSEVSPVDIDDYLSGPLACGAHGGRREMPRVGADRPLPSETERDVSDRDAGEAGAAEAIGKDLTRAGPPGVSLILLLPAGRSTSSRSAGTPRGTHWLDPGGGIHGSDRSRFR